MPKSIYVQQITYNELYFLKVISTFDESTHFTINNKVRHFKRYYYFFFI